MLWKSASHIILTEQSPVNTIGFYQYPKLIESATGKIVHKCETIDTGTSVTQYSSLVGRGGVPPEPLLALDPRQQRFAVADPNNDEIIVIEILNSNF